MRFMYIFYWPVGGGGGEGEDCGGPKGVENDLRSCHVMLKEFICLFLF